MERLLHSSVLRYLDHVARLGSIRRAAGALNVAASAVNRQILNLEAEIGHPLFERLASGVRLTPAGEVLLKHVRRTLADWRSTVGEIGTLTGAVSGEVRILTFPPLIISVLAAAIADLARKHEKLQFQVIDANATNKTEQMQTGYPDVALLPFDSRFREYEIVDSLIMKMGVVVSPGHPLAQKKRATLTECAEYPVIMMQDPWFQQHSDMEFRLSGADYAPRIQSNSWTLVREATRQGLGIGFFTPVGMVEELASGELVFIPVDIPEHARSRMSLYVHVDRRGTQEVAVTVERLKERFDTVRELLVDVVAEQS